MQANIEPLSTPRTPAYYDSASSVAPTMESKTMENEFAESVPEYLRPGIPC